MREMYLGSVACIGGLPFIFLSFFCMPGAMCYGLGMRTKGSTRFDSYFKIQVWEPRSFAWKDIQKAFPSAEEAKEAFPHNKECRVMMISPDGRKPV